MSGWSDWTALGADPDAALDAEADAWYAAHHMDGAA